MPLELTPFEARRMTLQGLRMAPKPPGGLGTTPYDALLVGRTPQGDPLVHAWLKVVEFGVGDSVLAWAVLPDDHGPKLAWFSDRQLIWLFRSPNPPAKDARVPIAEPIFALPGEKVAFQLRRVMGIDPIEMVPPSEMIQRCPGLFLDRRVSNPDPNFMTFGFKALQTKVRLIVECDGGKCWESSAGYSLVSWYTSEVPARTLTTDWRNFSVRDAQRVKPMHDYLNAYQALRLPGLRLLLEYRATRLCDSDFVESIAQSYGLTTQLVSRRLMQLKERSDQLALD